MSTTEENEQPEPEPAPAPNAATIVKEWVSRFERCARGRQYQNAGKLFHPNLVWMGIESNICSNLEQTVTWEFKEFWPNCVGFTIDFAKANIVPDSQSLLLVAPWYASGCIAGSPQKRGRISLVLGIFQAGKILGIHGHMSINPVTRIGA